MKKQLDEVKRLQKLAGIIGEGHYRGQSRYDEPVPFSQSGMGPDPGEPEKTVHIDDKRLPGGSASEIEKDYGLKVTPHEDGTFSVTGEVDKLEAYLEDYGIVSPQDNVN